MDVKFIKILKMFGCSQGIFQKNVKVSLQWKRTIEVKEVNNIIVKEANHYLLQVITY